MAKKKDKTLRGPNGNPNWKKGVSANPATQFKPGHQSSKGIGRKGKLPKLSELLDNVLGEEVADGITAAEIIFKALRAKAARGDTKAAKLLLEFAYGKPKQFIEQINKNQVDLTTLSEEELFLIEKIQASMASNVKVEEPITKADVVPVIDAGSINKDDGNIKSDTVS
jgi:hypothetical protein